jgi:hypothetical protein
MNAYIKKLWNTVIENGEVKIYIKLHKQDFNYNAIFVSCRFFVEQLTIHQGQFGW